MRRREFITLLGGAAGRDLEGGGVMQMKNVLDHLHFASVVRRGFWWARPEKNSGLRWLILTVLCVVGLAGSALAFVGTVIFVLNSNNPLMQARLLRNGVVSTCAALKSFPGTLVDPNIQYFAFTTDHPGPTRCVTFTYTAGTCGTNPPGMNGFISLYNGSFDPNNLATNYLGDLGMSIPGTTMGVVLQHGQKIVLVANGTSAGLNCSITVDIHDNPNATHNLNGDFTSDILWRDSSGNVAIWFMSNGAIQSTAGLGNVSTTWTIVGQRDFNDDSFDDILWRDDSGNVAIWLMQGSTVLSAVILGNVNPVWTVVGTGDFDGDGNGDILWLDSSGNVAIWFMNGTTIQSSVVLGNVGTSFKVAGTGDFNGDGKRDILWLDDSGNVAIWQMNGAAIQSAVLLGNVGTSFKVAGTGDFNGDVKSDILWSDSTGNVAVWLMNGTTVQSAVVLGNVGSSFKIAQTGDFGGDGLSDIVWIDSGGNVAIWFMNGTQVISAMGLGNVGTSWKIQGTNAD